MINDPLVSGSNPLKNLVFNSLEKSLEDSVDVQSHEMES